MAAARLHDGACDQRLRGQTAPGSTIAGPAGTIPQLSFGEVERGSFDADAVRGKIVVVGRDRDGVRGRAQDGRATMPCPGRRSRRRRSPRRWAASRCTTRRLGRLAADPRAGGVAPLVAHALRNRRGADRRRHRGPPRSSSAPSSPSTRASIVSIVPPLAAVFTSLSGPCSSPTPRRSVGQPGARSREQRRGHEPAHAPAARADAASARRSSSSCFGLVFQAGERAGAARAGHRRQRASTSAAPSRRRPVIVVAIDDETFNELRSAQWPFNRSCTRR